MYQKGRLMIFKENVLTRHFCNANIFNFYYDFIVLLNSIHLQFLMNANIGETRFRNRSRTLIKIPDFFLIRFFYFFILSLTGSFWFVFVFFHFCSITFDPSRSFMTFGVPLLCFLVHSLSFLFCFIRSFSFALFHSFSLFRYFVFTLLSITLDLPESLFLLRSLLFILIRYFSFVIVNIMHNLNC